MVAEFNRDAYAIETMSHPPESSGIAAPDPNLREASSLEEAARADRAHRIAAMLERWASEDCSDEPDWDVDQIEHLRLRVLLTR